MGDTVQHTQPYRNHPWTGKKEIPVRGISGENGYGTAPVAQGHKFSVPTRETDVGKEWSEQFNVPGVRGQQSRSR